MVLESASSAHAAVFAFVAVANDHDKDIEYHENQQEQKEKFEPEGSEDAFHLVKQVEGFASLNCFCGKQINTADFFAGENQFQLADDITFLNRSVDTLVLIEESCVQLRNTADIVDVVALRHESGEGSAAHQFQSFFAGGQFHRRVRLFR